MKLIEWSAKVLTVVGMSWLIHQPALSQSFPARPIRIVTGGAGGGSDFASRLIAQELTIQGQPVVVENRQSGVILGEIVTRAPADGYTMLLDGNATWLQPFLIDKMPFDVVKDLAPVIYTHRGASVIVVNPALPVNSVKELISLVRAKPGTITFGINAGGSSAQLALELLRSMAGGMDIVQVPYKGVAQSTVGVLGGEVQGYIGSVASVLAQIKSGKLKALAITTLQPSVLLPGVPTVAAAVPGYEFATGYGILAPAKTPKATIEKLNTDIGRILSTTTVKERFLQVGTEVVGGTPEQFAAAIQKDMTVLGKVIKDAGIREQ